MKELLYKLFIPVFLVAAGTFSLQAQNKDAAENKRIVEAKNYIFKAQSATSQQGKTWQLTPEYDLVISGDTIVAYLPYFGRAYSAPADPADGGIKFTSAKSDYAVTEKKNSWEISIKPRDVSDKPELNFTIFDNGNTSLVVTSFNRQSITFNGYIIEGKQKPKKAF